MGKIITMILTLYDIMGIQKFIFSTNKLKENIGASLIVSSMFKESPLNSIQDNDAYININDSELEGNDNTFRNDLSRYDIVNIYIAGGNALILYKNEDIMKSVNADLSEKFLRETGGLLSFAVAFTELNEKSFTDIFKELQIGIEKNKREFIRTKPLLGIGITKEELSTGLPVQIKTHEFGKDEYLSYQSYLKREYSKNDEFEKKYLGEDHKKFFCFPKELDKLGQKSGEDYIAIVHIDGNDFGTIRNDIIQNQSDIEAALRVMNELSDIITKIFESTMRNTIDDLIYHINRGNLDTVIERYENLPIKPLPIRPIILNGDDITFVCNGKLGLGLAECFLQNLYQHQ
ncbi:MAG: hypothetical protein ACOC2U_05635, partial [bacterium]